MVKRRRRGSRSRRSPSASCRARSRRCATVRLRPPTAVAPSGRESSGSLLHGRQRQWLAYLHGVVELIDGAPRPAIPSVVRRPRARRRRDRQPPQPAARASRPRRAERTAADRAPRSRRLPLVTHRTEDPDEHNRRSEQRHRLARAHPRAARAPAPRAGIRRERPDAARARGRAARRAPARRDRRGDQARGDRGAAATAGGSLPSTAARAGRCSSGSSSTSSSGASPTACTGTCRSAYNVLMQGTPEQIERYLRPALRGEGGDAYAVTEAEAGSDPGGIATTAVAHRRRLADQRREVVRHLRRRRARADRDGERRRRRAIGCRRCS